ncbi:MAG: MBL fold metallo-hydrolase [Actinomycetota bacterium]|nr:MBL fold metallo-hydrolase [Actinomycetota bacterium]
MTDRTPLGRATLARIPETRFQVRTSLFADTPAQAWLEHADLLDPLFVDYRTDEWKIAIQTWVVQVDGLTVLVDTGVGNGRQRPHMPPLDHLDTDFLTRLAEAGIEPSDVDAVINTHLHTDHVGWNTHLVDGSWVPTFPNARYLMAEADYRYFSPDGDGGSGGMQFVFADSVAPVQAQIELFSGDHQLSESLWLRPAPGHTPGSSVLWLDAGVPAVFVGDLTHSPIQIPRPGDPCGFDVDPAAAAATRTRIFTEAARSRAAVIPAHYPGHGGATLVAHGDTFGIDHWLDLPQR